MSQKMWPGELMLDIKPPGARCSGPFPSPIPKGTYKACDPLGSPFSVNVESRSATTKTWYVTATVDPPTPGIDVLLGCHQEFLVDNWCGKLGSGDSVVTLAPGERRPRYSYTVKVAQDGTAPFARQVKIQLCFTRDGLEPLCRARYFTTSGGKKPK